DDGRIQQLITRRYRPMAGQAAGQGKIAAAAALLSGSGGKVCCGSRLGGVARYLEQSRSRTQRTIQQDLLEADFIVGRFQRFECGSVGGSRETVACRRRERLTDRAID